MTSTSFNVGLGEAPRLSSRVLRPPGGGHTDIFGGEPEPHRGRRQFPGQTNAGQGDEPMKAQNGTLPTHNGQETPQQEQAAPETSPAKAELEPQPQVSPVAPEPLQVETPKAESPKAESPKAESPKAESPKAESPKAEPPKAEPPKVEPPKRVRVPPGGFSSGLW
ncbi:uncharacterized protein LOC128678221 isoform X2 [Plodia interpunctella]|nr:uncharacterized protein LOC128678221 isoform X2 [Plodia interpunctella]XP_053615591.1 uncharacterized protein LOC128678221 isoform X2 [Plodia interpunctella]